MSQESQNPKQKKVKSLDEEIAAAQERLARLQGQKREKEKRDLERNQKAIATMLRNERLDTVAIEDWTAALPALRKLLKITPPKLATAPAPDMAGEALASNDGETISGARSAG